jgi:hypothetical protein
MSTLRVVADEPIDMSDLERELGLEPEEYKPTSELRRLWEGKGFGAQDELYVINKANNSIYSIFLKPDGSGVVVSPVSIRIEYSAQPIMYDTPMDAIDWESIEQAIFPSGVEDYTSMMTHTKAASSDKSLRYKYVFLANTLKRLLDGYSPRESYIALEKYNPYE